MDFHDNSPVEQSRVDYTEISLQSQLNIHSIIFMFVPCICTVYCVLFVPTNALTRVVQKVMNNFFFHANWEQQTKESAVVDGTGCCVILECLVTSIACVT